HPVQRHRRISPRLSPSHCRRRRRYFPPAARIPRRDGVGARLVQLHRSRVRVDVARRADHHSRGLSQMRNDAKVRNPDWDSAIEFIVANVPRSALIEMYYWVQEPDLLRIIRALAGAPVETRAALDAFFDSARHA